LRAGGGSLETRNRTRNGTETRVIIRQIQLSAFVFVAAAALVRASSLPRRD
jgi:hypothetical protein